MSLKAPELNAVSFCCLRFSLLSVPVCLQAFALCSREFMCVVSCVLFFALCFSCFVSLLLDVGRARFAGVYCRRARSFDASIPEVLQYRVGKHVASSTRARPALNRNYSSRRLIILVS